MCLRNNPHLTGQHRTQLLQSVALSVGSGKSHLARELGKVLGVTPVHLDGLYYDENWKPRDKQQFADLQRELVAARRWVIDGELRLQLADPPGGRRHRDLPGPARLDLPAGNRAAAAAAPGRPASAIGVYERITWNFIRYITGYRTKMAPRVRQLFADHAGDPR
jgi:hypothetical protein